MTSKPHLSSISPKPRKAGISAMESKTPSVYYRLELDDYSAAAFTSFGKYYYGTLDEIRDFIDKLCSNEDFGDRFVELILAFMPLKLDSMT